MADIQEEDIDKFNENDELKSSDKEDNIITEDNKETEIENEGTKEDPNQIKNDDEIKNEELPIDNLPKSENISVNEGENTNEDVIENADLPTSTDAQESKLEDNENDLEPSKNEPSTIDKDNEATEQSENHQIEPKAEDDIAEKVETVYEETTQNETLDSTEKIQEEQPINDDIAKEQSPKEIIDDILEEIIIQVCGKEVVEKEVMIEGEDQEKEEINDENIHADRIEEVEEEDDQHTGRVEFDIPEGQREEGLYEEEEGVFHDQEFPQETESHYDDEGEEEEEMDEEELLRNQEDLITAIEEARKESQNLRERNTSLQHKLGDFLRKKKAAEQQAGVQPITEEKDQTDYDTKYLKQMEQLSDMELEFQVFQKEFDLELEEFKVETATIEAQFKQDNDKVQEYRQRIGEKAVNTRTGKRMNSKDIELLFANEQNKEKLVVSTRLDSIKLQNEVNKIKAIIQSKEELADGLHLIDFEQFKIENQSYNEKLEERNEDIMKLRKKITNNVHVLTHVKEKLEFTKYDCTEQEKDLGELDTNLNGQRDKLNGLKKVRDNLRIKNEKLKKSCGMLGNADLLRNYENCVDKRDEKTQQLAQMKNRHTELSLFDHTLKMKIDNSKQLDHL